MRELRKNRHDRVYHLISRIAHRAFCLDAGERDRFIDAMNPYHKGLALMAVAASLALTAFGSSPELTILSYNIRHGEGADGRVDLRRIADAIMHEKPDLVCLNEVDCRVKRSDGVDQAAELGRLTGMHATFAKAIDYCGGEYGNAVLSREKPLSVVRAPLPGKEPRVLLACEFADCWFFATHLDSRTLAGDTKPANVKSASIIRETVSKRAKAKPVFLAGDWNARPNSKTVTAIREYMAILSPVGGRTYHGFKTHDPRSEYCIDYITVDLAHVGDFIVKESHVTPNADASDHYPVAATLVRRMRTGVARMRRMSSPDEFTIWYRLPGCRSTCHTY